MSLQKVLPPALAVVIGVVNGIYVFKPYLENKKEIASIDATKDDSTTPLSALEPPKQPTPEEQAIVERRKDG